MLNDPANPANQGTVATKSTLDTASHDGTRQSKSSPAQRREALHAPTQPRSPPKSQAHNFKPEDAGDGGHQPTRRSHLASHAHAHSLADRKSHQETHPILRDLLPRLLPAPRRRNPRRAHRRSHTAPQTTPSPRLHLARRPRQAGLEAQQAPAAPDPPTAPSEPRRPTARLQASPGTELDARHSERKLIPASQEAREPSPEPKGLILPLPRPQLKLHNNPFRNPRRLSPTRPPLHLHRPTLPLLDRPLRRPLRPPPHLRNHGIPPPLPTA